MDLREKYKKQRKAPIDLSNFVYGKVPPQARDLEEAVLGAIMLEKDAFELAMEVLKGGEFFYVDAHQRIYNAMKRLSSRSQPIDMLTVIQELKSSEELDIVGGDFYVTKLTNAVVSSGNIETHSRIILQKFLQREMIRICGETITEAYEDSADAFEVIGQHEKSLTVITQQSEVKQMVEINEELVKAVKRIQLRRASDEHVTGIPSGFDSLDHITHGWQNTDLIILAARPAVGKTAFALNLARNAALHPHKPKPVAFFSLEMSVAQLIERIISAESEIHLDKIMTGQLEEWEMKKIYTSGIQKLAGSKLFFDDSPALNIFQLRAKCRKLKRKHDIGLIIIDYLQLMSGMNEGKGNREQEISQISRGLKGLAKELEIPIIALSQLSRELEKRKGEGFIPKLSDLRESGAIEQDADMVMFLYRPEYHDINQDAMGDSNTGETHIRIAKHRNGKLDTVKLRARLEIQKFVPLDQGFVPQLQSDNWKSIGTRSFYEKDEDITF
jgi:replicative DNA helicase